MALMKKPGDTYRVFLAALLLAGTALAHTPAESRALRLQIAGQRVEGLLIVKVPRAAAAMLFATPSPAAGAIDGVSVKLAPSALRGLRIGGAAPRVLEGKARLGADGVEAALLIDAPLKAEIVVEGAVPITFVAPKGRKLLLVDGPGREVEGGLQLRPRADLPCKVRLQ
jgi:hypothetical protein